MASVDTRSGNRSVTPIEATIYFTAVVAITYAFGGYLFSALVPEIRRSYAIGQDAIGIITGLSQIGSMLLAAAAGILAPSLGPVRLMLGCVILTVICQIAFYFSSSVPVMGLLMFLFAGAGPAAWVTIVVASQAIIPDAHRAKALGIMSSGTSYGLFLSGFLLPAVLGRADWRLAWLVFAGISGLALACIAWRLRKIGGLKRQLASQPVQPIGTKSGRWRSVFSSQSAVLVMMLFFGCGLALVPFQTYLSSMLQEGSGWSAQDTARVWSVVGISGMLGGIVLGSIADRFSIKWTLVAAFALIAIVVPASEMLAGNIALVYVAVFLFGLCYFAIFGLISAFLTQAFEPQMVSALSGGTFIMVGLGATIGNYLGGQIIEHMHGFTALFLSLSGCSALLALVASVLRKA